MFLFIYLLLFCAYIVFVCFLFLKNSFMSVHPSMFYIVKASSVLSNGWLIMKTSSTALHIISPGHFLLVEQRKSECNIHLGYRLLSTLLAALNYLIFFWEFRELYKLECMHLLLETSKSFNSVYSLVLRMS